MFLKEITITERGWPAHFIGGHDCTFRRNTLIECGETRVIVSTVGIYRPSCEGEKATRIGLERYYETMAFMAKWEAPYWDADVSRIVNFESGWALDEINHESDAKANAMHETVIAEIVDKINRGEFTEPA